MQVKFWGVRGSTPTPQPENLRYGGNTSCVEMRINGHLYVFDCGTGFRNLGKQILSEFGQRPATPRTASTVVAPNMAHAPTTR